MKAQLFTVPPNMAGFFSVILGTFVSDKIKARGPVMMFCCSLAIIGYIMLLVPTRPLVHYGGTFFVAAGVFPSSPSVMGWSVLEMTSPFGCRVLIIRQAVKQSRAALR